MNDHVQTYFDIFTRRASQNSAVRQQYQIPHFTAGSTNMHDYNDNMENYLIDLTMRPVSNLPYEKTQDEYLKEMGLARSKINGVITSSDVLEFLEHRQHMKGAPVKRRGPDGQESIEAYDPSKTVFALMAKRKQYPGEVADRLHEHPEGGFCERLRAASDALDPNCRGK